MMTIPHATWFSKIRIGSKPTEKVALQSGDPWEESDPWSRRIAEGYVEKNAEPIEDNLAIVKAFNDKYGKKDGPDELIEEYDKLVENEEQGIGGTTFVGSTEHLPASAEDGKHGVKD